MIIRYFASRQKRQEYDWCQIDIWAFRSFLPTGRQASSAPISKENKSTGAIADIMFSIDLFTAISQIIHRLSSNGHPSPIINPV
jgi:hypothetical protein